MELLFKKIMQELAEKLANVAFSRFPEGVVVEALDSNTAVEIKDINKIRPEGTEKLVYSDPKTGTHVIYDENANGTVYHKAYELKGGDVISADVLNKWCASGQNVHSKSGWQQSTTDAYKKDQIIAKISFVEGEIAFQTAGSKIWIKVKGLEEFIKTTAETSTGKEGLKEQFLKGIQHYIDLEDKQGFLNHCLSFQGLTVAEKEVIVSEEFVKRSEQSSEEVTQETVDKVMQSKEVVELLNSMPEEARELMKEVIYKKYNLSVPSSKTTSKPADIKVGDTVKIIKSGRNWNKRMDSFAGRVVKVTSVFTKGDDIAIQFEGSGPFSWVYSDGHFEKTEEPVTVVSNPKSISLNKPIFIEVGDQVLLDSGAFVESNKGDLSKPFTIEKIELDIKKDGDTTIDLLYLDQDGIKFAFPIKNKNADAIVGYASKNN